MSETQEYYSHGKLLLSGEYFVMKGAKALVLPVKLGQLLQLAPQKTESIDWASFELGQLFFTARFSTKDFTILETSHPDKAHYIQTLLRACKALNPSFVHEQGYAVKSSLEFNSQWGLGSSSTLINNLAQWAQVDAFVLNSRVSLGSGYDIAAAQNKEPFFYQIKEGQPMFESTFFEPPFFVHLNLLYLNKKMATENNIRAFADTQKDVSLMLQKIDAISLQMQDCQELAAFQRYMLTHEQLVAEATGQSPVQESLFPDFKGQIKSLGAWGGDFVLVASEQDFKAQKSYFAAKGFTTFFPLTELLYA